MVFFIVLIVTIAFIALAIFAPSDGFEFLGAVGAFICGLVAVIMVCCIVGDHLVIDGSVAAYEKRYEILTYQLENDLYDNDNDLGKKELYDQIQSWNEDLAKGKALQHDFWVGIFYPNIYDQFEFIELPNPERVMDKTG